VAVLTRPASCTSLWHSSLQYESPKRFSLRLCCRCLRLHGDKIQIHDLHERLRRNGYVNVRLLTLSHTYLSICVRRTDSRLSTEMLVLCWRQPFALFVFTPCTCVASVVGNERVYVYKGHAILCCRVRESLSKHWFFSCVQTSHTEFTTWRM
jgi:hypothetical protein